MRTVPTTVGKAIAIKSRLGKIRTLLLYSSIFFCLFVFYILFQLGLKKYTEVQKLDLLVQVCLKVYMSLGQLFLSGLSSCCCSGSAVRKQVLKFNYIGFCFSCRMEFF